MESGSQCREGSKDSGDCTRLEEELYVVGGGQHQELNIIKQERGVYN